MYDALVLIFKVVYTLMEHFEYSSAELSSLEKDIAAMHAAVLDSFQELSSSDFNKPKMHAWNHVLFWMEEFGSMHHYNSSTFETGHIEDVKKALDRVNSGADVPEQLLTAAKRFRVAVAAVKDEAAGGASGASCVGDSAGSSSSRAASGLAAGVNVGGLLLLAFSLKVGVPSKKFFERGVIRAELDFQHALAYHISISLNLLPAVPAAARATRQRLLRWEREHVVELDLRCLYFYTTLRAMEDDDATSKKSSSSILSDSGRRKLHIIFSIVASESYRGRPRSDFVFIKAYSDGEPAVDPFVARVIVFLTYAHHVCGAGGKSRGKSPPRNAAAKCFC
jgi:hypothetical protein